MIRFNCDYSEGAHPKVLEALLRTNMEQTPGYGEDSYCRAAAEKIKALCGAPEAQVHFLVGGTQANLTVIDAILRSHQGVLCADTGHINAHETGAVEACGHKVLGMPAPNGKISGAQVTQAVEAHFADEAHEHIVQPGMVYISNSTELGTIYTKTELQELSNACRAAGIPLFMDGARLGYALASPENDLTLMDLARLCDVFYLGGTKQGALFGEAVVITNPVVAKDFRYFIKQKGGMLAKGRLLGLQFDALLEGGLYFELAAHADKLALKLKKGFTALGFGFLLDSPTNQQFVILPDTLLEKLRENYSFSYQCRVDEKNSAVRFCTSWATREEDVDTFLEDLRQLAQEQ